MADSSFEKTALQLASEAVDLLPDGMKEAVSLALQAVISNRAGKYEVSQDRLRKLMRTAYSKEPYCDFLYARNEYSMAEKLLGDDPVRSRHMANARKALSRYLSSDVHDRPAIERYDAQIMKARADYLTGHRKGIFMGIVEIPENISVSGSSISSATKIRGFRHLASSDSSMILSHSDGGLFAVSLEEPHLMVVAAIANEMDAIECAEMFIKLVHGVMRSFSSNAFYVNGVMLSMGDVEEAMEDISGNAFPVWFFARGSESKNDDGYILFAEGAESFGTKAVSITGVSLADKDEASNALSLILVYHVFSPSARRSRSFTINDRTYDLVSSDRVSVSYRLRKVE